MKTPTIGFASLGCPKALTDSELILTQLQARGYQTSSNFEDADLVIVNTCGFIESAVTESLETITEALKDNGKVIVTGCLGAKPGEQSRTWIQEHVPQVLGVTGPHATDEVIALVNQHLPKPHDPHIDLLPPQGIKLTPKHYAYLKISEGCNHHCSFCIIPSLRGKLASRGAADVLKEAKTLLEAGVKELILVSQDTSAYGVDVKYRMEFFEGRPVKTRLYDLAKAMGELAEPYGAWIRLHYVYPYPHVDDLMELMQAGLILPYLDIPLQHSHPDTLSRMKRPAGGENHLERIAKWRSVCPDLVIRSTFIAGFPGETESEFEHLLDFLKIANIDHMGCFAYSDIEGATANELANPVPEALRQERQQRVLEVASQQAIGRRQKRIGHTMQVLIDKVDANGIIGRTYADAPEVDGVVHITSSSKISAPRLKAGLFARVHVTGMDGYDWVGQQV